MKNLRRIGDEVWDYQNTQVGVKRFRLSDFNENLWDLIDPDSDRKQEKAAPISRASRTQLFLINCSVSFKTAEHHEHNYLSSTVFHSK